LAGTGSSTVFLSNRVLASLQPDARAFIVGRAEMHRMETGDILFDDGAPLSHAVFPLDCVVSFIADFPGHQSVERASVGAEGYLGFALVMESKNSLGKAVVQIPGKALWLAAPDFELALQRDDGVRSAMLRYARSLIVQLMDTAACNSLHTAEQRVARWLLQARDRVGRDEFHVTQEAISQLLALRRATVNAVCSDLMNTGAITYNRGHLIVTDREALHARCCTCYDRIRLATKC
jgi:CRP-like cAMP-binding protein